MRISQARFIEYDPVTDIRQEHSEAVDPSGLEFLTERIEEGEATIKGGLLGWGPYTHTLYFEGHVFHVKVISQ
jgi:hypothetical protein